MVRRAAESVGLRRSLFCHKGTLLRTRRTRLVALGAAILIIPGVALSQGKPTIAGVEPIEVNARVITSFEKTGEGRATYGKLEWRGGLVLSSPSPNFGGWSGIALEPSGNKLFAVSDAGAWITAELVYGGGRIKGLRDARMGPIKALNGKPLVNNNDRDAEAVTLLDGTFEKGTMLISFERNDRIGRFPLAKGVLDKPSGYFPRQKDVRRMRNEGMEAMAVMHGGPHKGSVLAISEVALEDGAAHLGWIWVAGEPKRFSVANIDDFGVTDAASLADGTLLILERRFRWSDGVKMRLRRIEASDVKVGALLKGEVLLSADMNQEIDNMEGLAVHELPSGEVLLTMISDDNFNTFLQRTVLLQFAIPAPKNVPEEATSPKPAAKAQ